MSKLFAKSAAATLIAMLVSAAALAQDPNPTFGLKPYDGLQSGQIDNISATSGALAINIPLISYPQRGGKLKLGFALHYENRGSYTQELCVAGICTPEQIPRGEGWVIVDEGNAVLGGATYMTAPTGGTPYTVPSVMLADGSSHTLAKVGSNAESLDATGIAERSGWIITPDGVRISTTAVPTGIPGGLGPQVAASISDESSLREDPNGNQITFTASGWVDTLGRAIPLPASTTNYTSCVGPLPTASALIWNLPGSPAGQFTAKICYAQVSTLIGITRFSVSEMQSVILPNGTTWVFKYDAVGNLSEVDFPTGGKISYTWGAVGGPAILTRTLNANDGTGDHTWNYQYVNPGNGSAAYTVVTDPDQNEAVHTLSYLGATYTYNANYYDIQDQYYQGSHTSGTLLKTIETNYSAYVPNVYAPDGIGNRPINVVPIRTTTIWPSGKQNKVEYDYDTAGTFTWWDPLVVGSFPLSYGRRIAERDYDYGNGAPGALLKKTSTAYMALTGPNSSSYMANNLLNLPYTIQVQNGGGTQVALNQYNYDENSLASSGLTSAYQWTSTPPSGTYRGNKTSVWNWLNTGTLTCQNGLTGGSGSYLISKMTYFDSGTLNTSADPCNDTNTFTYSLTYWGAFPTTVKNALNQSTTHTYDFNTGLILSTTDPNSLTTSYTYDSMWRLATVTHPDGGEDIITHQESTYPFSATLQSPINTTQSKTEKNVFDGFGRLTHTQLTSDPQGTVFTDTTYDSLGRVSTVSNPYRSGTDATTSAGTTTYGYDALSRKTTVTYPDNSVLTTAYCGPSTLVTDPTLRWRRSRIDGLGHLVEVDEPNSSTASVNSNGCPGTGEPIWVTAYTNDALGNLTNVVQNGTHPRAFTYDSLSRLLTSQNPENGTLTYAYYPDGGVKTKADLRPVTITYKYDALHRPTNLSYSNGDTATTYTYDQASCQNLASCQNIGYRTSMTDGAGAEHWAYRVDTTNHRSIHQDVRTTGGKTKTTTYYINTAGDVTQILYPTGRTVTYTYDAADRPSTAVDSANGLTYATGWKTPPANTNCIATRACYTPQGSLYGVSIGQSSTFSGLNILNNFSNRMQPAEFKASSSAGTAMDITYSFIDTITSHNAGHVNQIINNLNSNRTQTFSYDQLNRILTAKTTATSGTNCWGYQYNYDAWANLNSQAGLSGYNGCSEYNSSATADGNNHLSGFTYDSVGNTLTDGNYTYTWNGESEMKTAAGVTYQYDGDGRRVTKTGSKLYWYGSGGEILSETDASGNTLNDYVFFDGKRVAQVPNSGSVLFYAVDFLGSSRTIVQSTGTLCYDADFTPYGSESVFTNTCPQNYKFEGKERDTETANDDFGARYYSWRFGRWLSSDWSAVPVPVPYATLPNPQTLNLYGMVGDDPETSADLDGHVGAGGPLFAWIGDPFALPSWCLGGGACQESTFEITGASDQQQNQDNKPAQNSDPTAPPPPPTPDPAGTRTDPALNPSNSNSSATNSPADQTQAPLESRAHGKGERGTTSKPEFKGKPGKLPKGVRPNPDKPGQYQVKDPHTGNWVDKQPGWSPYAQRVGVGAAIVAGAVIVGRAVAGCFASGICEAAAF